MPCCSRSWSTRRVSDAPPSPPRSIAAPRSFPRVALAGRRAFPVFLLILFLLNSRRAAIKIDRLIAGIGALNGSASLGCLDLQEINRTDSVKTDRPTTASAVVRIPALILPLSQKSQLSSLKLNCLVNLSICKTGRTMRKTKCQSGAEKRNKKRRLEAAEIGRAHV